MDHSMISKAMSMRMSTNGFPEDVLLLKILWAVLMVILAVLVLANMISGISTVLYGVVVLAVMFAEMALRSKIRQSGLGAPK